MRKTLIALGILLAVIIAVPRPASAHESVSIGLPGFGFFVGGPVYGYGPPVVYAPPVYAPPVYRPYYQPRVYYAPRYDYDRRCHHGWYRHHGDDRDDDRDDD